MIEYDDVTCMQSKRVTAIGPRFYNKTVLSIAFHFLNESSPEPNHLLWRGRSSQQLSGGASLCVTVAVDIYNCGSMTGETLLQWGLKVVLEVMKKLWLVIRVT
ncbi:hypothetical protein OWV82_001730 [Melia azedarach]|uniref:Uncharacterized protein n=1 Tax=Melia azedarach TaxID=155640 RepID=A0ACC1YZQ6_MELAZ|nr:hypothetical protein OWV82_001730 [Melia azedarach]